MKTIDVALLPNMVNSQQVAGSVAVVIDVLRASSTILTALSNGAKQVIPVNEPQEAKELAKQFPTGEVLLCGEREGNKIPGFDLGNSPREFVPEVVAGKTLIMSTTNGTKACHTAQNASVSVIGCFLNLTAVTHFVNQAEGNVLLITSGKEGRFSLEDVVCAGAFVDKLNAGNEFAITDAARVSQILYTIYKSNLRQMFNTCEHGQYLASLGYQADLDYCAQVDTLTLVPRFTSGIITS
ncbi:MAG: 2-phosphosulfolactate phosphatase [bacterium]|nr:2-phosphosulfolactate phosphatase [bacterium]